MQAQDQADIQVCFDPLEKARDMHTQVNKLLLLGAGDSGKSTLFKQMKSIYGPGFTERERSKATR